MKQRRRWFNGLAKVALYAPVKLRWRAVIFAVYITTTIIGLKVILSEHGITGHAIRAGWCLAWPSSKFHVVRSDEQCAPDPDPDHFLLPDPFVPQQSEDQLADALPVETSGLSQSTSSAASGPMVTQAAVLRRCRALQAGRPHWRS